MPLTQPLFDFLDVSTGNVEVTFVNNQQSLDSRSTVNEVIVELFNPTYHDGKVAALVFNLSDPVDNSSTWSATDNADVFSFWKE